MTIKFSPNDKGTPKGKLADFELHFDDGPLGGLKLVGFAVWQSRCGNGRAITVPARQYSINGERRSFAVLRPIAHGSAHQRFCDVVLSAYAEHEAQLAAAEN